MQDKLDELIHRIFPDELDPRRGIVSIKSLSQKLIALKRLLLAKKQASDCAIQLELVDCALLLACIKQAQTADNSEQDQEKLAAFVRELKQDWLVNCSLNKDLQSKVDFLNTLYMSRRSEKDAQIGKGIDDLAECFICHHLTMDDRLKLFKSIKAKTNNKPRSWLKGRLKASLTLDDKFQLIKKIDEQRNRLISGEDKTDDTDELEQLTELRYELAEDLPYVLQSSALEALAADVKLAGLDGVALDLNLDVFVKEDEAFLLDSGKLKQCYTALNTLNTHLKAFGDGELSRAQRKKIGKLQLQLEQVKTQIMLSYMIRSMITLDIAIAEDDVKKQCSWLMSALFGGGAALLTAYGAAKGYTSIMALLTAASVKGVPAAIASGLTVGGFLLMYWSFETRALAKGLQISTKFSKSTIDEWERQFACFDFCTDMLKRSMRHYVGNANTQTDDSTQAKVAGHKAQVVSSPAQERAQRLYQQEEEMLQFFHDTDLLVKHQKVRATADAGDTTGQRIGKGFANAGLASLNGLFVGFLGMSTVATIAKVAVGSALFASALCPYTLIAIILGVAAGVLVSWFIKKHGTNLVNMLTGRTKIKELAAAHAPSEQMDGVNDALGRVRETMRESSDQGQPPQAVKVSRRGFFASTMPTTCAAQAQALEEPEDDRPMKTVSGMSLISAAC